MKVTRVVVAGLALTFASGSSSQQWTNKGTEWARPFIRVVQNKGMLAGYPDGSAGHVRGEFPSKWDLAVTANALVMKYSQVWSATSQEQKSYRDTVAPGTGWELSQLKRLIRYVSKELQEISNSYEDRPCDPEDLLKRVDELSAHWAAEYPGFARPFPDVPSDHWATGAVANLRNAGILVGYPSGEFGKPKP
ncbi:MAG: S-layer homology domain-containing protein [Fimbriimonadaceae bacterium]|nr:S-layer homology domain-containing protein [Fimbriimonadaceae bacterium]